ncbi:putative ATP-grasp-modified RiPP [Streptomyces sp. 796.1]|uniref:putative ATP-grasp-modified RiPP n=1 Tax=Streptomyces sp. 796.1 TaxID=3163029 RepID=UPI0039C93D0C
MTTIAHPHEAFPLASAGAPLPHSSEQPKAPHTRPWILRYAVAPEPLQATVRPSAVYDAARQISVGVDTDVLPYMVTHRPTVPDGDAKNPPPLDEGPKD